MQGVGNANDSGVLVLGATNLPWSLDSAMRRRFEKRIYIPLPDMPARLHLLKNSMKKEDHNLSESDFQEIAQRTELFSGSDMNSLVKNACFEPLRKFQNAIYFMPVGKNSRGTTVYTPCAPSDPGAVKVDKTNLKGDEVKKNTITKYDFFKAIENTKPTVSPKDLATYEEWTKEFGMDG
jgi:vacuolar protein-sorting-associated protein 4